MTLPPPMLLHQHQLQHKHQQQLRPRPLHQRQQAQSFEASPSTAASGPLPCTSYSPSRSCSWRQHWRPAGVVALCSSSTSLVQGASNTDRQSVKDVP